MPSAIAVHAIAFHDFSLINGRNRLAPVPKRTNKLLKEEDLVLLLLFKDPLLFDRHIVHLVSIPSRIYSIRASLALTIEGLVL